MRSTSGTFLLRFSDSELGGITIAWVAEDPKGIDYSVENVALNTCWIDNKHYQILDNYATAATATTL